MGVTADLPFVSGDAIEGLQRRDSKSVDGQEAHELTTLGAGTRRARKERAIKLALHCLTVV